MRLARGVLWLCVLVFGGMGLAFIAAPTRMAGLVEVQLPTPTARVDFVATYGGFELGLAAFLLLCARRDDRVRVGLLAGGLSLLGFAVARAAGIALERGQVSSLLFVLLAAEILGTALCFWAAGVADADLGAAARRVSEHAEGARGSSAGRPGAGPRVCPWRRAR